jgi:hypothetical protein
MGHHDEEAPSAARHKPANRLGLEYRAVPPRRLPDGPIIDVHTHARVTPSTPSFFEAAAAYGIDHIVSMSPLEEVDALRAAYPGRLDFIAIPRWREFNTTTQFREHWLRDLAAFREKGARVMKFWMAPPMRGEHGLTLGHPFLEPVIRTAIDLGYDFMVHAGDPSAWWEKGKPYADTRRFGTKADQYPPLEKFLEAVAPRYVIGAHMGGFIEDPDFLQGLLDRHANYHLDSSATKWIARGVAARPERCREFMIANAGRVLFGTDVVVDGRYDFDHYASRYWTHQMMWETAYRGESPIDDPDSDQPPPLAGLKLPETVLSQLYAANAQRLGMVASR